MFKFLRSFNFIETVNELFDNPSYMYPIHIKGGLKFFERINEVESYFSIVKIRIKIISEKLSGKP